MSGFARVGWTIGLALALAGCAPGGGDAPGADLPGADVPDARDDALDAAPDAGQDPGPPSDVPAPDAADVPAVSWDPERLVVMSFNLRTWFGEDGINGWEFREPLAIRVVHEAAPDILGAQEAVFLQVEALDGALAGYDRVGRTRTDSIWDEACPIWYRRDRFERIADDTFQMSDTPEVAGSNFSENQLYPRITTWVRLRDRASGRELVAFNTHWGYEQYDDIQPRSAALTLGKMAEIAPDLPAVLSGDFNCGPGQAGWEILVGNQEYQGISGDLVDPWVELDLPEQGTGHGFTGVATRRIDNVFHTPDVAATAARIVADREGDVFPSDHFPVVVELAGF